MFEIRFLWKNLKNYRWMVILALSIGVFTSSIIIINPFLSRILVDDVIKGNKHEWLVLILSLMVTTTLVRTGLRYLMQCLLEWSSQRMIIKIRNTLFKNILTQEMKFFDKNRSGDLITRVTGDLENIRHTVAWTSYNIVETVFTLLVTLGFLIYINITLTLALMAIMSFMAVISRVYSKRIITFYRDIRTKMSDLNTVVQENIGGNRVVKAFSREEFEIKKFDKKSKAFKQANLKASMAWQKLLPVIDFMTNLMAFTSLTLGGYFAIKGKMSLGEVAAFTNLTWALAMPMQNISSHINEIKRFYASSEKITELYYSMPAIIDRHDAEPLTQRMKGKIEFDNVSFGYTKKQVLQNISFVVEAGETAAIMGPTGSGKTTLISLLTRFYEVTGGSIKIDGINIKKIKLEKLRKSIGIANQDVFLFSDTVDSNIAFSDPLMSEKKVVEYAKLACADDFILKMENGYETIIGERGVGISGGQRQRIALARALAAEPPILVLDDTTSAVDTKTEEYIKESLNNLPYECTKLIIAQRISTVMNADKIILIEKNGITVGVHEELAANNRYYRDICELQDVKNLPEFVGEEGIDNGSK